MENLKVALSSSALFTAMFLAGCSQGAEEPTPATEGEPTPAAEGSSEEFPTEPITMYVSFSAGGGTDVGARILAPYVEDELGVPVEVVNRPGGGGWVGWNDLVTAEPDGYTMGYINTPNIITGYLNPETAREYTIEDFAPIANHVTDYGAIAVDANDERFQTIDDLIAYAQENTVTTTSTGVGSDDHITALKINQEAGTNFEAVHGEGAANGKAGVLGGHIDAFFANVGEVAVEAESGEMRVLAVAAPERSEFLPDVPTLEESGIGEIVSFSARGIAYPNGVDEEKMATVQEAFEAALNNPDLIAQMEEMGLAVEPIIGDEYAEFLMAEEEELMQLTDLLGW